MSVSGDALVAIACWTVRFAVDVPFTLAGRTIAAREYCLVRVTAEDGREGHAYTLTRDVPVQGALAAEVDRHDGPWAIDTLVDRLQEGGTRSPALARAAGLLDLCRWDLAAQRTGQPVWALLGGAPRRTPVSIVEGYPLPGEADDAFVARLVAASASGATRFKLAHVGGTEAMAERLTATRAALGDEVELVVDIGSAWPDVRTATDAARAWEPFGLAWIEDPFPVTDVAAMAALRAGSPVPIGAGDDASLAALERLCESAAVDVLRVDVTTAGGLTGVATLMDRWSEIAVSPHVYAEVGQHLVHASSRVHGVEVFGSTSAFDFVDRFVVDESLIIEQGQLEPTRDPGLGLRFRQDVVDAHAVGAFVADATRG